MDIIARLKLSAQTFTAEFNKALGDAERKAGSSGGVIGRNISAGIGNGLQDATARIPVLGGALSGLSGAALLTAAGLGAVSLALSHGVAEAEGYEKAVRQLDAVLKATGNSTGFARDQILAFADEMEGAWATPAEEIIKAQQVLASFDGVAGDVFQRAISGAADMSAVFGGDLSSNVEKVGIVLQNLAQGEVKGLERGFKFLGTETLTAIGNLAEAGRTADAQRALLKALEERVGGAKAADGKGLSGAFFRLSDAIGDTSREIAVQSGLYGAAEKGLESLAGSVTALGEVYKSTASLAAKFKATVQFGKNWFTAGLAGNGDDVRAAAGIPKPSNKPAGPSAADRLAADRASRAAYDSAERLRQADKARDDAEKRMRRSASVADREAEKAAREQQQLLDTLRGKYADVDGAAQEYAKTLASINALIDANKIDRMEGIFLGLKAGQAKNAADFATMEKTARSMGWNPDLRDLMKNGDADAGIVGENVEDALTKAGEKAAEALERNMTDAVETVADILTGLIGGKAGRLVGDLFSLAGGGRAGNPALDFLFGGKGVGGMINGWKFDPMMNAKGGDVSASIKGVEGAVGKLEKANKGLFGLSGEFTMSLGRVLAAAGVGATAAGLVSSSKGAQFGGMAGGAIGEVLGKEVLGKALGSFAGPLGTIAGGLLGGALGSMFSSVKWGRSTISFADGELSAGAAEGNSGRAKKAASATAKSIIGSLESIIDQLGGDLISAPTITVGTRHDDYRVNTSGTSLKKARGAVDFDGDQQAAIEYAIEHMLSEAVIDGISQASINILKSTKNDLETKIMKAGLIEAIPKNLKAMLDPVGAAIDGVNDKWEKVVDALREGGASVEQMAEAQKLYKLEMEEAINSTERASQGLRDFQDSLGTGSSSPLSLRDQEGLAKASLQPLLDKIDAGQGVDQAAFQKAAQTYLDIERQLYGSTGKFFEAFQQIQDATAKAISAIDNAVPISDSAPRDPFAEKTATATQASAEIQAQMSTQLNGLQGTLNELLAVARAGGINFVGSNRNFG